jgi:hypothetical protein
MAGHGKSRPSAIWLWSGATAVGLLWLIVQIGWPLTRSGALSMPSFLLGYLAAAMGLIGFWRMRWWGVLFLAVIALAPAIPTHWSYGIWNVYVAATAVVALVLSFAYQSQFRL